MQKQLKLWKYAPLLDKIISPYQSAFITGRSMVDSIITCHELMHHINRKKETLQHMLVQIDLAKTYDKVELNMLWVTLQHHGFPSKFLNLIFACITMWLSFTINFDPIRYVQVLWRPKVWWSSFPDFVYHFYWSTLYIIEQGKSWGGYIWDPLSWGMRQPW